MAQQEQKKYGLTLSKKSQKALKIQPKSSVFGDDSDDEDSMSAVNRDIKKESKRNLLKKQTQQTIEKALAEDPTIFDYDGVYDNIQETKQAADSRTKDKEEKKSRYVGHLLKAAEIRTKENERRVERKVQKEREEEKGQFDDKEAFVTSAYKEKMRLMQEEAEKEKRMDAIEAAMEVKNQRDMTGFYRHILNQTTGEDPKARGIKKEESTQGPEVPKSSDIKKEESTQDSEDPKSRDTKKVEGSQGSCNIKEEGDSSSQQVDFSQDRDISGDSSSSSSEAESDGEQERRNTKKKEQRFRSTKKDKDRIYRRRNDSGSSGSLPSGSPDKRQSSKSKDKVKSKTSKQGKRNTSSPSGIKDITLTDQKQDIDIHSTITETEQRKSHDGNVKEQNGSSSSSKRKHTSKGKEESGNKSPNSKQQPKKKSSDKTKSKSRKSSSGGDDDDDDDDLASSGEEDDVKVNGEETKEQQVEKVDPMAKYAKRNVGEKFDDARMRYLMRKQQTIVAVVRDED